MLISKRSIHRLKIASCIICNLPEISKNIYNLPEISKNIYNILLDGYAEAHEKPHTEVNITPTDMHCCNIKEIFLKADRSKLAKLFDKNHLNAMTYMNGYEAALQLDPKKLPDPRMFRDKIVKKVDNEYISIIEYYLVVEPPLRRKYINNISCTHSPVRIDGCYGTSVGSYSWPYLMNMNVYYPKNMTATQVTLNIMFERGGYDMPWDDGAFASMLKSCHHKPTKRDRKKAHKIMYKTYLEEQKTINIETEDIKFIES